VREDTRWYCQQALGLIIGMLRTPDYGLEHVHFVAETLLREEAEFLAWLGMDELAQFTREVLACLADIEDKDEALGLIIDLHGYSHRLQGWTTHYFPWALGLLFPHGRRADVAANLFK
jgi:hypothetical protein